ncbi:uncharacterized protein E0L32_002124 [Thyridium curvatum]|uniref:CFEM domain-containing protein n=1 Tax=Thyridium curvatum TaxID=1093900 RepID=A0A507ARK5_9PEZI|nr:uncharacterized protein E0L32_002009 [Thyridium curvatum]XP_030989232.1 uncharacterized protein E0L32_002124 [Thyridium curvatum]TPX07406.1 hypothetical protein E0L32_002009 [Thyridium curvatum]TPX07521.1 hypothetical protein E0L32_002124 [Thyridium curvatum]
MYLKHAIAAAALVLTASAQNYLTDLPSCSLLCLHDGILKATNCEVLDYACHCTDENYPKIQAASIDCLKETCGSEEALNVVVPATKAVCAVARAAASASAAISRANATATKSTAGGSATAPPASITGDGKGSKTPTVSGTPGPTTSAAVVSGNGAVAKSASLGLASLLFLAAFIV